MVLTTGKKLIAEARRIHKAFLREGAHWSIESCLETLIENTSIITNEKAIAEARIGIQIFK